MNKVALGVGVGFAILIISFGMYMGWDQYYLYSLLATPFVTLLAWIVGTKSSYSFLRKWEKWAKERGWEEEKPKGD